MNKRFDLLAAAVLGIGLAASPAFAQEAQPAQQQPAAAQPSAAQPAAAQPADQAAPAAGAQPAGDRAGASAQASEAEIRPVLVAIVQGVTTKGGASTLSQQFAQNDQDRLKDLSKDTTQLDQSVDQLRAAYKEKYQKDLDLTAGADGVFNSQLFRIGGGASDAARQASAQLGADQSSNAAGAAANPSAGVSGTAGQAGGASGQSGGAVAAGASGAAPASPADSAQAASSSAPEMLIIAFPAAQDIPEARLNLVKEGGTWKIDAPASVDGQQLNQRLQQQLQAATAQKDQWPADANEASRAIAHRVIIAIAGDAGAAGASGAAATGAGTTGTDTNSTPPATPAPGTAR